MGGTHPRNKKFRKRGRRARRRIQQKKKKGKLGEGIFNISGKQLSREEILTLDKGIKFAPKRGLNKFETYIGVQKFIRKLNVKKYYALNPIERLAMENNTTGLKNNSVFNPHIANNKYVDLFKRLVTTELEQLPVKKVYEHRDLKRGIESLDKRTDIVIGGGYSDTVSGTI